MPCLSWELARLEAFWPEPYRKKPDYLLPFLQELLLLLLDYFFFSFTCVKSTFRSSGTSVKSRLKIDVVKMTENFRITLHTIFFQFSCKVQNTFCCYDKDISRIRPYHMSRLVLPVDLVCNTILHHEGPESRKL